MRSIQLIMTVIGLRVRYRAAENESSAVTFETHPLHAVIEP
jgi:hypothetical protein